ncbi:hypothetical protein E2562_017590 [Oryza meyeriana var. granulata]|uniref:Uncharacterized protein n=1 Tax=Oryza meyeriana var. granulata TaxID=110450 RepID=A0A6G1BLE2_9ORYZ|nr:hypothetical protein E2562_017590 [Oryza meyeriana var. granulata]
MRRFCSATHRRFLASRAACCSVQCRRFYSSYAAAWEMSHSCISSSIEQLLQSRRDDAVAEAARQNPRCSSPR